MWEVTLLIWEAFFFKPLHVPKITGTDCVGLVWDSEGSMVICLVYGLPSIPADGLLNLLEAVAKWGLRFPKLLVLGDFSIHVDTASIQTSDLITSFLKI